MKLRPHMSTCTVPQHKCINKMQIHTSHMDTTHIHVKEKRQVFGRLIKIKTGRKRNEKESLGILLSPFRLVLPLISPRRKGPGLIPTCIMTM